tara:strand:- start:628 stop:1122 length:495 start_codon:yes stop_codon:yes gene_type:complete
MIESPFLTLPKELLYNIFIFLNIPQIVAIKKIHAFSDIQGECDRVISMKLERERNNLDNSAKKYIRDTLYYLAKDLATVIDLPDPYYIQKVFYDRDKEIKSLIPKIDYSMSIEKILGDRIRYDNEFNDFYSAILNFYKENKCNTFPSHPAMISIALERIKLEIK